MRENRWILMPRSPDYRVKRYFPAEKLDSYKSYYQRYYAEHNEHIQFIIELFREKKTDETQLAATVLACSIELTKNNSLDKTNLLKTFYEWHDKKKRFTQSQIFRSFEFLKANNLLSANFTL